MNFFFRLFGSFFLSLNMGFLSSAVASDCVYYSGNEGAELWEELLKAVNETSEGASRFKALQKNLIYFLLPGYGIQKCVKFSEGVVRCCFLQSVYQFD